LKTFIEKIKHFFGIHKYVYLKKLSERSDLIECKLCKKKFCINYELKILLPWDKELEKFYKYR